MERAAAPAVAADEKVFALEGGLFGFPQEKRFLIVDLPGGGDIFKQMVSVDNPELAFTLVDPFAFFPAYAPDIPEEEVKALAAEHGEELIVMAVANVPQQVQEATVNLKAPIVFNPYTRRGRQVILAAERHSVRERLFRS